MSGPPPPDLRSHGQRSFVTRTVGWTMVAAVATLAVIETAFALTASLRVPTTADWESAASTVRAEFTAGDLIVFAPAWVDPIGRSHLGDLVTPEMAGRADSDRYRRVWELSIRDAHALETKGLASTRRVRHGGVSVALYAKPSPPVEIAYDFTSHAGEARVTELTREDGTERPCYRDEAASARCGSVQVGPRTLEIDYQPRRGILAPVLDGRILRIEFSGVELGASIVGYTGLHDYFSRKNAQGKVDLQLFIDGRSVLQVRHANEDGWRRFAIETAGLAGQRHVVRFEITAANAAWRTFGFHAEARR